MCLKTGMTHEKHKSKAKIKMSDNIPFEIELEIVKRLPLKSMVRFRLVSKHWNSFIGSSEFISTYHVYQPQPPPLLLARYIDHSDQTQTCLSILDNETFTQQKFPDTFTNQLRDSKIIDSSHGLLCVYGYFHCLEIVVLWNPLIGISVGVELPFYGLNCSTAIGFGVCPVTNDPTIVMIEHTNMSSNHFLPWVVEIFTLSSRTWKTLQSTNMPRKTINAQSSQVVIGKFIYWSACERVLVNVTDSEKKMVNMILSFDLTTHEFDVIDFPDTLSHEFYMNVLKLRDSLAVLEYIRHNEDQVCDVWVMEEDGITKSFTKLFKIHAPNASFRMILGFGESGVLMETEDNKKGFATLEDYEPWSEQITELGINGEAGSFFVKSYTETLLLLDQSDGHIFKRW